MNANPHNIVVGTTAEIPTQEVQAAVVLRPLDGIRLILSDHPQSWADVCFEPEDILEIRAIPPKQLNEAISPRRFRWSWLRRQHRFHPWVMAGQLTGIADALRTFNHLDGVTTAWGIYDKATRRWAADLCIPEVPLNIYCSANPRLEPGASSGENVALARCLVADIENTAANAAVATIAVAGLPKPTMVVNSGHGTQAWWRLTEPTTDLSHWTNLQKRLIQLLRVNGADADPKVHDPARLMRLPGFVNVNGTPALAHIVEADPARRYDVAMFDATLPKAAWRPRSSQPAPNGNGNHGVPTNRMPLDRRELLKRALGYQRRIAPIDGTGRNNKLFEIAAKLTEGFDLHLKNLHRVAQAYNRRLPHPLDDGELQQVTENAYRHVQRKDQPRGGLLDQGIQIEPWREPKQPTLSLTDCQEQMRLARIESLGRPGKIFFDGSTTGAGKTTADQAAMQQAESTITFLPTHEACRELAETLVSKGFDAAAFPRIDETTCNRFADDDHPGDAQNVQAAGLDVGVALCPKCRYYRACDYQKARTMARKAQHAVATHARAAHSVFAPAEGRQVIFLHEDCMNLLRPTTRITAKPTPNGPSMKDLRDILEIAKEATGIADTMGDGEKAAFAAQLFRSTKELIAHLDNNDLLREAEEAEATGSATSVNRVRALPLKPKTGRPDGADYLLFRAIRQTGLHPHGDAMRLCLGYACGELESLCLVIDDAFAKATKRAKQHRQFFKSLVAVRRVDLPGSAVVWLEDATANYRIISDLVGRPVVDRTPRGRLEWAVPPLQYTDPDVTQDTSANIVRGIVRGLLAKYAGAQKVGIITHRNHLADLKALEPFWKARIARMDYFRSGNDRASNKWLDCDLLLILGTPRVPPAAIREGLIQIGNIEEAGGDGRWGIVKWQGRTSANMKSSSTGLMEPDPRSLPLAADGAGPCGPANNLFPTEVITVEGRGYHDPAWAEVHEHLVQANLLQAIGRGRGVRQQGVPVVVVSNEHLGLPLLAGESPIIKDPEAQTFMAMIKLTVKNPKYITLGKMTVTTAELAAQARLSAEETRRHCIHLMTLGLLARKGQRGGWMLKRPEAWDDAIKAEGE